MSGEFDFTCLRSRQRIAIMLQRLELGDATRADLGMAATMSSSTTTRFLRHLIADGKVKCVRDFKKAIGVSIPAIYAIVEGTVIPEVPIRVRRKVELLPTWRPSSDERKVTITTSWPAIAIPKQSIFAALGL